MIKHIIKWLIKIKMIKDMSFCNNFDSVIIEKFDEKQNYI